MNYRVFETFQKLSNVENVEECSFYLNWLKCTISGVETYIPMSYVDENNKLTFDYNPTEIVCKKGDEIEVEKIVLGLIYGYNGKVQGWVPAYKCASI